MLKRSDDMTQFQSTLSVRRATGQAPNKCWCEEISIHALRKESDESDAFVHDLLGISIHALRKESD